LGNTYPNPIVAKLNGVALSGTPSSGQTLVANSGTAASWQTPAAAYQPWQFHVAPLGGGQDDTPNLRTALTNAANYMAANQGYAEVLVDPALYTLSSALTNSGQGNAQLPLPVIGAGVSGGILVIRCTYGNGGANPYFAQTVAQKSGAIFRSTLTAQTVDATYGAPYILGGPATSAYAVGTANYNNLMVILDGITFMPQEESGGPTLGGVFLGSCAKAQVVSGAYIPDTTVAIMDTTQPTHNWVNALYMPYPLNNDNNFIGTWSAYGAYRGVVVTSHVAAQRIIAIYCNRGIGILENSDGHAAWIGYLSVEGSNIAIYNEGTVNGYYSIVVDVLDCEALSHYSAGGHVADPSNGLYGSINIHQLGGSALVVSGATYVQITCLSQKNGPVTAPTVPGSGTALQNPFWRTAMVNIQGGTVTGIAVGGVTLTGVTSGVITVPSGKTVTLTYSAAPTWQWVLQ
jgi:hypothetical protein